MFPTGQDFAAIVQATDSGILVHEAATKNILWANEAACRMFGFDLDELRPLKAHHMSSPERRYRREVGVAWLQEAVVQGSSRRRWKYRAKDGREFLTDALATRVQFQDGPMVVVAFRNVTEEDQLQAQLAQTAGYLQRIMVSASAGVALLDEKNRIEDISHVAARLLGTTVREALGQPLDTLASAEPALSTSHVVERLAQVGRPVEVTLEVRGADQTRWVSMDVETIPHDGIESRIAALRDITERVELARRDDYQQAKLQYLSRYNAMGDMAITIAHELGQPLAAARNCLTGIQSRIATGKIASEDLRYGLDLAERQLTRASEIVSSVKRYVQRFESSITRVGLNKIVEDSLYFARLRAAEHGIELRADLSEEDLPVLAERILVGQVVLNLCFNAVEEVAEALPALPRVLVRTYREGETACCEVVDEGRGLAGALEGTGVRDPFSTKEGGSGIGLVICERIMERHGGELVLGPNQPAGTVATAKLPIASVEEGLGEPSPG